MICGKEIYKSKSEAKAAIQGLHAKRKGGNNRPICVYFCDECQGFHVASKRKKKRPKSYRKELEGEFHATRWAKTKGKAFIQNYNSHQR